jgi:hypothetical protein
LCVRVWNWLAGLPHAVGRRRCLSCGVAWAVWAPTAQRCWCCCAGAGRCWQHWMGALRADSAQRVADKERKRRWRVRFRLPCRQRGCPAAPQQLWACPQGHWGRADVVAHHRAALEEWDSQPPTARPQTSQKWQLVHKRHRSRTRRHKGRSLPLWCPTPTVRRSEAPGIRGGLITPRWSRVTPFCRAV